MMRFNKMAKHKTKKLAVLMMSVIVVLLTVMPISAWADPVPESSQGTQSESESTGGNTGGNAASNTAQNIDNILLLDDTDIFEGMSASYQQGYEPTVENHTAVIVLPLYTQEEELESIQVTPDLGATDGSPFVYRNYQKTVQKTTEQINGSSDTEDVFLVRFELELQTDYYNGIYPVVLNVSYRLQNVNYEKSFTCYVQLRDGKSQTEETEVQVSEPVEEAPTSEPKLIIEKCEDMPETIYAGDIFDVTVFVKNTNKQKYVQNMTVTISTDTSDMILQADSNVLYFDSLGANQTLEIPLKFLCTENMKAGMYSVTLDMSYDNPDATSLTSSGKFDVMVSERMQVELEVGYFASEVNAGDSFELPIQLMNLGKGAIYNARCVLEVPGLTANQSLFLGNLEGGTAISGNMNVFAGMVNKDAKSEEARYGTTNGKVMLTYEDENGKEYQVEEEIEININPLEISASVPEETEDTNNITTQLWIGIGIVIAIILIGSLLPLLIRKIRQRHTYE